MCKFEVNIFTVRFSNDFSLPLTSFEMISSKVQAKQAIIKTALSKTVQAGLSQQMATRRSYIKWIKNKEKQKANKHRQIEQITAEAPPRKGQ